MAWVKVPPEHHPLFLAALPNDARVETMKMFGGVAAKVNGHIFAGCSALDDDLAAGADRARALALPGAAPFDPMGDGRARSDNHAPREDDARSEGAGRLGGPRLRGGGQAAAQTGARSPPRPPSSGWGSRRTDPAQPLPALHPRHERVAAAGRRRRRPLDTGALWRSEVAVYLARVAGSLAGFGVASSAKAWLGREAARDVKDPSSSAATAGRAWGARWPSTLRGSWRVAGARARREPPALPFWRCRRTAATTTSRPAPGGRSSRGQSPVRAPGRRSPRRPPRRAGRSGAGGRSGTIS